MGDFNSLMVLMIICLSVPLVPAATIYTVGELSGWSMQGGDYSSWASDKIFAVGDTLVFNYVPGHTVDEVTANDYNTCTIGNAIASDSSGATSITLKTAGSHYFICGIPGHCAGGMKLFVNVGGTGDSSSTIPTSPSTTATSPSSTAAISPSSTTAISPSSTNAISPSSTAPSPATTTGGMTTTIGTLTQPSSSITLSPFVALFFTIFVVMIKSFMLFY